MDFTQYGIWGVALTLISGFVRVVVWPYIRDVHLPERNRQLGRQADALERIADQGDRTGENVVEIKQSQHLMQKELAAALQLLQLLTRGLLPPRAPQ